MCREASSRDDLAAVRRCLAILAELFHAQGACGTSTIGSSEAILLGGLAMKRRWTEARKAQARLSRRVQTCV